jgi:hypothetical protein
VKKILLILILAITFIGCSVSGLYILNLSEVERPESAKERYGEQKIINFDGGVSYVYEDELIKIAWFPSSTQFGFVLENKSDYSIKVIWDDAAYVNTKGSSGRIIHSGIKYNERNNLQPSTVIPKNTYLDDIIIPTENIYYEEWSLLWGYAGAGWRTNAILPNKADSKKELNRMTKFFIGKTVKILLPLQVQETVNDYIFTFNITDFVIKKRSER